MKLAIVRDGNGVRIVDPNDGSIVADNCTESFIKSLLKCLDEREKLRAEQCNRESREIADKAKD